MATENNNQSYTFRFKLVYTGLTRSVEVCVPVFTLFTWAQFMDQTQSARQQIINNDNLEYDIVVSGQPDSERAPALNQNFPPLTQGLSYHNNNNHSLSFYIRPKNQSFVYYLRENCPNEGLLHSLSVSDTYELFLHGRVEGAQADTGDDEPPIAEPEMEPTCQNMNINTNPIPTQDTIPTSYNGMCSICFENRELSDHWQCYIPDGANRHGICDTCFNSYRNCSSRAQDCPVCRQPLGATHYGEIAPVQPVVTSSYVETFNPPEPSPLPNAIQDFHYGGSGAAGPQDSEDAAVGPPEPNHHNFLNNYSNWNWNNTNNHSSPFSDRLLGPSIRNYPSGPNNNITTSAVYDYINNMENVPRIEVRNQEIIIRNIPYNEMVDLQRHNPNNNITNTSNNTLRHALFNVISTQINNISNNNGLDTNIFNTSFYNVDNNVDNNGNPIG